MRQWLFSCALAGLLGVVPACIIVTDDEGSETVNDTGNDTGNGTTSSNDTAGDSGSSTAAASGSSEVSTAADDTAAGACGWGPTGQKMVPEGYVCGGDGEDPDGNVPLLCPEGVELVVGGDCGDIEGPGCCDAAGNAWFCGDAGAGEVLSVIEC
jgi:hypothetical protein